MQIARYTEPFDVHRRLAELGLDVSVLRTAVARGYLARQECTQNHPRFFPATAAWAETVAALRELLLPREWARNDDNNFARVVSPDGRMSIIVATGNEATGLSQESPATKAPKGRITVEAVAANNAQLSLVFGDLPLAPPTQPTTTGGDESSTYVLLMHWDGKETRCELSFPVQIGAEGRITDWKERIILPPIPGDVQGLSEDGDNSGAPDVDVPVRRRP